MTQQRILPFFLLLVLLVFGISPVNAQNDIAVSALGSFSSSTTGFYTQQDPFDQAGVLVEFRHIWNPLYGYELAYSANRANQAYINVGPHPTLPCTPFGCPYPTRQNVRAYDHEVSADWVVSVPFASLRPFALAGGGVQMFEPMGGQMGTQSDNQAVFVYGAGLDWTLLPQFGLRFQYRGNLYKAPSLAVAFPATDKFTHSAEPVIGFFIRF
ncbi:MAG: outer membrane beta-barrel protein [Acidobacteria bacterium]|jgi:opacity protein-like surface antigen|nr:outer membrane beta-barrel protein [Acidobacteriota bacterium]